MSFHSWSPLCSEIDESVSSRPFVLVCSGKMVSMERMPEQQLSAAEISIKRRLSSCKESNVRSTFARKDYCTLLASDFAWIFLKCKVWDNIAGRFRLLDTGWVTAVTVIGVFREKSSGWQKSEYWVGYWSLKGKLVPFDFPPVELLSPCTYYRLPWQNKMSAFRLNSRTQTCVWRVKMLTLLVYHSWNKLQNRRYCDTKKCHVC